MSWLLAFAGFAALVILHEAGHFAAAKATGMRVERFSLFFPPLVARWRPKGSETEYAIGAIPLGGYVKISGMTAHEELPEDVAYRAYHRQAPWKRIVVIAAGPAVNVLIAFLLFWGLYVADGETRYTPNRTVASEGLRQPAASKLRPGDYIVSVDGAGGSEQALRGRIASHRCAGAPVDGCRATTAARVVVRRGGRTVALSIVPRYDARYKRTRLGFAFGADRHHRAVGPGEAVGLSLSAMWRITRLTGDALARIVTPEGRKQLSGVVGSYEVTHEAFTFDAVTALRILAIVSLSLAIINLFPFLPLDGGHIFWAAAEKLRGRAIPFAVMERAGMVGFVLIVLLFAIGLSNDIGRITSGEGFGLR